jgi:multiple sugar transport system substrate-binding protein
LLLSACGGTEGGGNGSGTGEAPEANPEAVDAALEEGGKLTWWTWTNAEPHVKAFEKQYPNVDIKLVNVGTGTDHYTKLLNALKAGEGAPDVAQVEYHALPQFGLPGYLVDLRQYGFDEYADEFTPSDWEAPHVGDALYGLPQGGGPMVLFYNKRVFDEHDLTVPETWEEFLAEARKLKEADPDAYFTGDPGEPGEDMALMWQAGGRPFQVDGEQITIDFQDEGTQRWVEVWNQMLQEDHLAPFPHWSEEWFKALGDGTIATLPFGGWMAGAFAGMEDGVGDWRVAPLPTYDGGEPVSSHHGGSNHAVMEQSENPELAAAFVRWLNKDERNSQDLVCHERWRCDV